MSGGIAAHNHRLIAVKPSGFRDIGRENCNFKKRQQGITRFPSLAGAAGYGKVRNFKITPSAPNTVLASAILHRRELGCVTAL
jgi:hypothetical protein